MKEGGNVLYGYHRRNRKDEEGVGGGKNQWKGQSGHAENDGKTGFEKMSKFDCFEQK